MGEGKLFTEWLLEEKKTKEKKKKKMLPPKKPHPLNKTRVPLTMLQMGAKRLNLDKCQSVLLPSTQFRDLSAEVPSSCYIRCVTQIPGHYIQQDGRSHWHRDKRIAWFLVPILPLSPQGERDPWRSTITLHI